MKERRGKEREGKERDGEREEGRGMCLWFYSGACDGLKCGCSDPQSQGGKKSCRE